MAPEKGKSVSFKRDGNRWESWPLPRGIARWKTGWVRVDARLSVARKSRGSSASGRIARHGPQWRERQYVNVTTE